MLLRDFYLGKRIIASNFNNNKTPYKLTFAVTYNCNSKCSTCNIWKRKSENELSTKEIDTFFKNNPYFLWIDLTGGEIFLRSDLLEIVKIIANRCKKLHTLHFPTNGLMTKHIYKNVMQMKKLGLNKLIITVSIDGPQEIHDKIRGVDGGFKRAIETLKKLREIRGVETYAGMTLSKDNVKYFDETVHALKTEIPDFTHRDLHINIAHSSSHFYGKEIDDSPVEEIINVMSRFMRLRGVSFISPVSILEYQYQKRVRKYLETKRSPMSCHSLSVSIFMDPYGNIYPCTTYNKKIGNIRHKDLKGLLYDPKTRRIAREIRELKCPQCWTPCEAYQTILANLFKMWK